MKRERKRRGGQMKGERKREVGFFSLEEREGREGERERDSGDETKRERRVGERGKEPVRPHPASPPLGHTATENVRLFKLIWTK